MSLDVMTNKITWWGHVATTLQLPSFLGASSIERVIYQRRLIFVLWNGWKNLLPKSRKVRKKNQIPEYHAPSPEGYDKEDTRSINEKPPNLVGYWGGKPKDPWNVIGKKPPNLQIGYFLGRKPEEG